MAIIYEGICCALCDQVIDNALLDADDFVATTHFLEGGPLWRFSDAAMHRTCFMAWDQREAFIRAYNERMKGWLAGNGTYTQMAENGDIVIYNEAGEVVIPDEKAEEEAFNRFVDAMIAAEREASLREEQTKREK